MAIAALYPSTKPSLNLDFANTKTLDPRITFSRASTATYYDGKTFAKAEENLLSYSQEFDNAAWAKTDLAVTANAVVAPDGATTADKLVAIATTGYHGLGRTISHQTGMTYVLSVYAKSAEYTKLYIAEGGHGQFYCSFDLGAGTAGTPSGSFTNLSASITSVAGGYYRCTLSFTTSGSFTISPSFVGYPDTGATLNQFGAQYTGDGTSGIYIWGAQLEQRSSATAYTPTTSQPITNYIPVLQTAASGVPRFDHNPTTGESLGLLIEEQRTNLLLRSQEFDDASWVKYNGATITSNSIIAPDGTLTGDTLYCTNTQQIWQTVSKTSSAITYTQTVYAKKGTSDSLILTYSDFIAGGADAIFDLAAGTIINSDTSVWTNVSGTIQSIGNGWYRCSITATSPATGAIYTSLKTNSAAAGASIYIWGAQLEAGSFPTSYIPTTTAQVTRSADAASMTGSNFSSWYRQDEGTIFIENNYNYGSGLASGSRVAMDISDGTGSNRFSLYNSSSVANVFLVDAFGSNQAALNHSLVTALHVKSAFAYALNNVAYSQNGLASLTDTTCLVPRGVNKLEIGNVFVPGYTLNGHIKKIAYYPSRLSNSVLQALTT